MLFYLKLHRFGGFEMMVISARISGSVEEAFRKRLELGCGHASIVREALIAYFNVDTRHGGGENGN